MFGLFILVAVCALVSVLLNRSDLCKNFKVECRLYNRPDCMISGRPRRTWLRTAELDLQSHNLGLNSAWRRAQDRLK